MSSQLVAGLELSSESQNLLFIGGLSVFMTEDILRKHFEQFGVVDAVKVMIDKRTKRSKGYAFIAFHADCPLETLLAQTHIIDGRKIDCQPAAKTQEKKKWKEEQKRKKVFINNLPPDLTTEDLEHRFGVYGAVRNCYVIRDFHTQASKRYGFVEYTDEAVVAQVIDLRLSIDGHDLEISSYKDRFDHRKDLQDQKREAKTQLSASQEEAKEAQPQADRPADGLDRSEERKEESRETESLADPPKSTKYEFISLSQKLNEDVSNYCFALGPAARRLLQSARSLQQTRDGHRLSERAHSPAPLARPPADARCACWQPWSGVAAPGLQRKVSDRPLDAADDGRAPHSRTDQAVTARATVTVTVT
jgi:RNA recognition motif-containing protein